MPLSVVVQEACDVKALRAARSNHCGLEVLLYSYATAGDKLVESVAVIGGCSSLSWRSRDASLFLCESE